GVGLFVPITACYRGMAHLEQGRVDEAREALAGAREAGQAVGYTSIVLRASIYLALALGRAADVSAALDLLREARNTARQQGFSGLEAEALLAEAIVRPVASGDDRVTNIQRLQACIAIAVSSGARPLLLKAETLLERILATAEDA